MLHGAKGGRVRLPDGGGLDYVRFGKGPRTLVMIPGLGDGLRTVKGAAIPLALSYHKLADDFTVCAFSRRDPLPQGQTTADMAGDLADAMSALHLPPACVLGVSLGGMIAQQLALAHPERVERLVLAVTLARPNAVAREVVNGWLDMAARGDYRGIMVDTAERSYSEKLLARRRGAYALLSHFGKPDSFERFIIQANACLSHDCFDALPGIACPTLVIGGEDDRIVTGEASREIAARIPGSRLFMYEGLGHGLYEEARDFPDRVADFCR